MPSIENLECTFDEYSNMNNELCGGINYITEAGSSSLAASQLDPIPSEKTTYITDITSIGKKNFKLFNDNILIID